MNLKNYGDNIKNSSEDIKTLDKLLEKLKNPEELLEYMGKNIKYGYIGKENKIYSPGDVDFDNNFDNEYFLQNPEQLLISKHGVCWDQAEFERHWFSKKNYQPELYFMMFAKEDSNNLPTHTFLVYKNKDKVYWFENSFERQRGIHEYESLNELIKDVMIKHFDHSKKWGGAKDDDFKDIRIWEYEEPNFGCNCEQFMNDMVSKNLNNKEYNTLVLFRPNFSETMLTHSQKEYMVGIPENASANIQPWDPNAAKFAEGLIEKLEHVTGLEIFWGGSLALGILGQNDVDLTLFSEPNDFEKYLQGVVSILGEPKYKLTDKILWRTTKDGHKVDAYLGSKNSEGVQSDIFFSNSLKNNPALLQEYISLKKEMGLSAREYYKRKNEFYNKVLTLQHPPLKSGI